MTARKHEAEPPSPAMVAAFVGRLQQHGVQLWVVGEDGSQRLRVRAPEGRLSADDRRRLARWKDAIIATVSGTDGAPASAAATTTAADTTPHRQIGQIPPLGAEAADAREPDACPRCAALSQQAAAVLAQLQASLSLPPALRGLPPERLAIFVKWSIIALTNPRPQWPPPRPTDAGRRHRPDLGGIIAELGGRPAGAEPDGAGHLDADGGG